jgi:hypothetical protein
VTRVWVGHEGRAGQVGGARVSSRRWRRRSFTTSFAGGSGDAVIGGGTYMLLQLEEGEGVMTGWSIENEGARRGAHR